MAREMIRVLLAEDQVMFRTAVRRLLELEDDIEVVAEVARGDEIVPAALAARPDVAVVDIEMPAQDGLGAAVELRQRLPSCRTLILTMYDRAGFVHRAMEGGVSGFVLNIAVPLRQPGAAGLDWATGLEVAPARVVANLAR
jgi:two-component system, NarL family, response regulator DesR